MRESARETAGALVDPVDGLLLTWSLVSMAITVQNGAYRDRSIVTLVVGLAVLVVAALLLRTGGRCDDPGRRGIAVAAGVSLAVSLGYDVGLYGEGASLSRSRAFSMIAAGLAVTAVVAPLRHRLYVAVAAGITAVWACTTMIVASPRPAIDVWFILTEGSRRLSGGDNLFTGCWPGNTDRLTDCVYPYLPATTVVQTPFRVVLGDVRFSYVAALLATAVILWRLAGPRWGPVLGVLLLVSPKVTFLVEQAWTEPLLLLGIAVMVWATVSGRSALAVAGFAFALACKQHTVLLVPLAAFWPAFGWRRTLLAVGVAAAFTAPWFLADPDAFLDDAVRFHLDLEPRRDSLSLYSTALNGGWTPPFALVAAASAIAVAVAIWLLPRTATGFVLGCAFVQYVFDIVNKQSFFNHWWLVSGLLLLAVATVASEPAGASTSPGPDPASGTPAATVGAEGLEPPTSAL